MTLVLIESQHFLAKKKHLNWLAFKFWMSYLYHFHRHYHLSHSYQAPFLLLHRVFAGPTDNLNHIDLEASSHTIRSYRLYSFHRSQNRLHDLSSIPEQPYHQLCTLRRNWHFFSASDQVRLATSASQAYQQRSLAVCLVLDAVVSSPISTLLDTWLFFYSRVVL